MSTKDESLDRKKKNALEVIKEWKEELESQYSDSNARLKEINQVNQYWMSIDE